MGQLELDKAINNQNEVYVKPGKEKQSKLIQKGSWWFYPNNDTNRKPKFNHTIMVKFICQEYHIVRYPDADGDIYIYNSKTGIYELDKTGRKLRKIIRSLDNLKDNSVKEVRNYIVDMCDVRSVVNNEYVAVKMASYIITQKHLEHLHQKFLLLINCRLHIILMLMMTL